MFCYMKLVVVLTTIIILIECKPNVQRCANFCLEGIAIEYEDSLGMTYKQGRILYSVDKLFVSTNRISLLM